MTRTLPSVDAFRAFMGELIDYAGLFPPASLELRASVQEYARLRSEPEAWMLGRFIVPAGRLAELAAEDRVDGPPWRLAVIVEGEEPAGEKLAGAANAMQRIVERSTGGLVIESVETRLPPRVLAKNDRGAVKRHCSELEARLAEAGFATAAVFFEATGGDETMRMAVHGIAERRGAAAAPRTGLKLRCGGPRPEDVPRAELVAAVIAECAAAGVPLKLTAGLHHPLRLVGPNGSWQHGFLNVFGAGVLTASGRLDRAGALACLLEEDAASFRFDGQFGWRSHTATPAEIAAARRALMVAFGSCSFAEPRDDLRALGLLS